MFTVLAVAYLVASMKAPALTAHLGRRLPPPARSCWPPATRCCRQRRGSATALGGLRSSPALLLVGGGMGLVITPLTSTVLASLEPSRAGAASGALSTMQQVGNAIGVAVTGVVFFGALGHGFAHAFELSLAALAVPVLAVARAHAARSPAPRPLRERTHKRWSGRLAPCPLHRISPRSPRCTPRTAMSFVLPPTPTRRC